jgi:hypothetical protein
LKTEIEIRWLLNYLQKLEFDNFKHATYKLASRIIDENGEEVKEYKGEEAWDVLGRLQLAIQTLEWVLEQGNRYKGLDRASQYETKHYKDSNKVMYDLNGKEMIPDNSIETFVLTLEDPSI